MLRCSRERRAGRRPTRRGREPFALLPLLLAACGSDAPAPDARTVHAARGDVVRVAVATGDVAPERESAVTSDAGGVVTKLAVALGDEVSAGQLLAEVRPRITDRTLLDAERGLLAAREGEAAAQELAGRENLAGWLMWAVQGEASTERMLDAAERGREAAEERLRLLREGRVRIDDREIDFGVRAPVAGTVLALPAREGDPVVPASIYGEGTRLAVLGDLQRIVFRGTVPETEVARLEVGMPARVRVAALPDRTLDGRLTEIGLSGTRRDETVVFDVRIALDVPDGVLLRSGYSATAELELQRATDAITLPERVIEYRDGRAFVLVPGTDGEPAEREITTGVSDGLTVAIVSGLEAGEPVLERDWRSIR